MSEDFALQNPSRTTYTPDVYYVYILQCSDNSYYTGYTPDIPRRLKEHNAGYGSRITRSKRPVVLVHHESYRSKSEAMRREAQIKSWSRAKKKALIDGDLKKLKELSKRRK